MCVVERYDDALPSLFLLPPPPPPAFPCSPFPFSRVAHENRDLARIRDSTRDSARMRVCIRGVLQIARFLWRFHGRVKKRIASFSSKILIRRYRLRIFDGSQTILSHSRKFCRIRVISSLCVYSYGICTFTETFGVHVIKLHRLIRENDLLMLDIRMKMFVFYL